MDGTIIDKQHFPSPSPLVRLFLVTYMSQGLKVKGLIAEPIEKGIYEGFLYLRGGIKNVGMVRPARIAQFASEGFVVFAPFYRGNRGGEGNEDFAGDDRHDAFSAFTLLKNLPNVQENRVHIFGFSRGGVMALFTAIQFPEAASIVTWGGVSDLSLTYVERKDMRRMMKRVIGGSPKTEPDEYESRTPLYELEKLKPPVLIIHGELDNNVSVEHARRLEKRLQSLGMQVEAWYFKNFTHYFPPAINREVVRDLCLWMKKQRCDI
ncbi:alpha/beta hydrolase family protein [Lederbergia wuyishanensis]|uniref:Dipeptidyl aminopeptidase/acylaminoacyl peptidase n=1 Tax=Lederbergia wuyishanensis TaxID=1347903 RepID=A0ABU0D4T1_9BACI|nr:prolyl oligopeptidase family serine peptidase [Lederbergia wuyishanensis]MCJ8009513.1 prolyl oligopeptidase family serine peptidase [Lederbergia wuyishanensis]MDQ0343418.1 dipeptidyl aminopeptidase/acylaminoacyl peptidase [Lederbergia wuyishanensis]